MMLLLLNNPLFSQISWEINLSASNTAPIRNCSPVTLTFDLIQAEFDTPMTGVVLELLLLDDVFQIVENAAGFALTTPPNPNVTIGGRSYDVWRLTGVTIPAFEVGSTVHLTLVQTGDIDDPAPSVFYRATYGANGTGNQPGPLLIPDVTYLEIGTTPASQTLLSEVDEEILPVADVLIRGTLVADVNFDFDGAYRIYMDENALIQVENGVELKFTDQTTIQGCTQGWQGIEVLTGGKLTVDGSTDQSADKVLIQGAEHAIVAHDSSKVLVREAIFRNNETGILVPKANDGLTQTDLVIRASIFENDSRFPGFFGLAGVQVERMVFPLQSVENIYRGLLWDILGVESKIVSQKDYFENCSESGISVSGPAFWLQQTGRGLNEANPTFVNCYTGISAQNTNITSRDNIMKQVSSGYSLRQGIFRKVHISNNRINADRLGIAVSQWYSLPSFVIENNEITVEESSIYGTGIFAELLTGSSVGRCRLDSNRISIGEAMCGILLHSSLRTGLNRNEISLKVPRTNYGILLENTDRSNLFCNYVEGAGGSPYQTGIVLATTSLNNLLCNTLDQTGLGIHYLGENMPTTMRGNQFNNHQVALQYGWPAPGTFPPIGAQTGIQSHHRNQWLEIYQNGKFGVGHYGTETQVQFSTIEYDPADEPDPQAVVLTTNEEVPNGSVFRDISGNTYFCTTEPAGCPPPTQLFADLITEADIHIAKGNIDAGYFSETQAWVARRQLYRRLLEDTTLLSADESIEAFFSQETFTSAGIYERLHRDMSQLYVLDPVNENELEGYLDTIMVKVEELHIVEELLNDQQLTSAERDSLLIEKQSLLSILHTITELYIGLDTILEVERISRATRILSDNANAPVDKDFETNQQTVNRIMLEYIIGRQTILTDSQEIALRPIANSCPWNGGPAVYLARAVLDDSACYNDDSLCYVAPQPISKPRGEAHPPIEFRIFPNPGSSFVTIESNEEMAEDGEVMMFSALGIPIHKQTIKKGERASFLIFHDITPGVYYLTLHTSSQHATKIITILK